MYLWDRLSFSTMKFDKYYKYMKILKRQFFIKIIVSHDRMDSPGSYYMVTFTEHWCSFGTNFIELVSFDREQWCCKVGVLRVKIMSMTFSVHFIAPLALAVNFIALDYNMHEFQSSGSSFVTSYMC